MLSAVPENIRLVFKAVYPRIVKGIPEGTPNFDRYEGIGRALQEVLSKTPEERRRDDKEKATSEIGVMLTSVGQRTESHNDYDYDYDRAKEIKTIFDQIRSFVNYGVLPNRNCAGLIVEKICHPHDYLDTLGKSLVAQVGSWQARVKEIMDDVQEHYRGVDELYTGRKTPPSEALLRPLREIYFTLGYAELRIPVTIDHCKQGIKYPKPPTVGYW